MSMLALWYMSVLIWWAGFLVYAYTSPRVPPGFAFSSVLVAIVAGTGTLLIAQWVMLELAVQALLPFVELLK